MLLSVVPARSSVMKPLFATVPFAGVFVPRMFAVRTDAPAGTSDAIPTPTANTVAKSTAPPTRERVRCTIGSPSRAVVALDRIAFYKTDGDAQGGGVAAEPEELVTRAVERSGLSEFGADGWQEGLAQLVAAVEVDLGAHPEAVATFEEIIVSRFVHR